MNNKHARAEQRRCQSGDDRAAARTLETSNMARSAVAPRVQSEGHRHACIGRDSITSAKYLCDAAVSFEASCHNFSLRNRRRHHVDRLGDDFGCDRAIPRGSIGVREASFGLVSRASVPRQSLVSRPESLCPVRLQHGPAPSPEKDRAETSEASERRRRDKHAAKRDTSWPRPLFGGQLVDHERCVVTLSGPCPRSIATRALPV